MVRPYIFYRKINSQVVFYYDPVGIEWQTQQAAMFQNEKLAIKKIMKSFKDIEPILKAEKSLSKIEFSNFLNNIRRLWPWLNYMWWAIEYKDKHKQPLENIMAVRKATECFVPGLIAILRNTIKKTFPNKDKYTDVLLLSEIESEDFPNNSVLEKRLLSWAYTKNRLYNSWEKLESNFNLRIERKNNNNKRGELIGQSAFPGMVKGRIKIVTTREDVKTFKRGDILVASVTTPDLFLAMQISAAIISEQGGIISHASIFASREFKIPCVVGVAEATQILKNGDLVEVNATDGIIKVLRPRRK